MSYRPHNFETGQKLYAYQLDEIEEQIILNESEISGLKEKFDGDGIPTKEELSNLEARVKTLEDEPAVPESLVSDVSRLSESIAEISEAEKKEGLIDFSWENKQTYTTGNEVDSATRITTKQYVHYEETTTKRITIKAGYRAYYYTYSLVDGAYVYADAKIIISTSVDYDYDMVFEPSYYYRFNVGRRKEGNISPSDATDAIDLKNVVEKVESLTSFTKKINGFGLLTKNLFNRAKTPIITWIDDDTVRSSSKGITFVKQLADELGIKCTFACITNTIEGDASYNVTTRETLLSYQAEGFQVTTHSANHDNAWKQSSADYSTEHIESEITNSIKVLKSFGFLECDYLVTPYGLHGVEYQRLASKWCKALINAGSTHTYNRHWGNGRYDINRVFISNIDHADLSYYTNIIDDAIDNGDWIVFGTHSGMTPTTGGWDYELVKNVLQYAINKGVRIATLSEAFKERKVLYDYYDAFR